MCSSDLTVSIPRQFKNQADIWGRFLVWFHAAIRTLLISVRTPFTLILAPPEPHIFGAFVLNGKVTAVELADQVLERHIDTARVPVELVAIKVIIDGLIRGPRHLHRLGDLAPGEFHLINLPVFMDLHLQPLAEGVDTLAPTPWRPPDTL